MLFLPLGTFVLMDGLGERYSLRNWMSKTLVPRSSQTSSQFPPKPILWSQLTDTIRSMTEEYRHMPSESKEGLKLSFRRATEEDIEAYLELERTAIGNKTYSGIVDKDEAQEDFSENEVYLIYKDGKLAGSTEFEMKSPEHAYLSGVVVHPDFQGQGIAREAALFRLEKLKGVKRIDVVTHPENIKIIDLYESLGFTVEKQIENYFGDGEPRVMLARVI